MLQNITQSYNNQNSTMVHQWIIDEWDRVSHPEKDSWIYVNLISDKSNFLKKVKVKSLSRVRLFVTRWTVAHQAPPSMGFSRQEYWSGLPFPSRGSSWHRDRTWVPDCRQTLYHLSHQGSPIRKGQHLYKYHWDNWIGVLEKRSRSYTSKKNLDGFLNIERQSYRSIKGLPRRHKW